MKNTPGQASEKLNEKAVFSVLQDKGMKLNLSANFNSVILFRTDDKKNFLRGERIKWSYKLNTIRELILDTYPSYGISYIPEGNSKTYQDQ